MMGPPTPATPLPPLADGEARFVGDPIALVIANDRYIAEDATDLVDVDFEPLSPVVDYLAAESSDQLVHSEYPANVIGQIPNAPSAALEEVFASAPHVVRESIYQQAYTAVPMETRASWSSGRHRARR